MMSITEVLNFVAIDIETTGLDERKDEIIELAAIRYVKGKETERFQSFVRPHYSLPKFVQQLTNITSDMLKDAPYIKEILPRFREFVGSDAIVGHNVQFDIGFINYNIELMGQFPMSNALIDTLEISRIYLPFVTNHKLGTLVNHYNIPLEDAHRADADAKATAELFVTMMEYITQNFSMISNGRLNGFGVISQSIDSLFFRTVLEYQKGTALTFAAPKKIKSPFFNIIENSMPSAPDMSINDVFSSDGLFSQKFPNFEYREGQLQMAEEVYDALSRSRHLAIEAGTGIGKSFAYLVPALNFSNRGKSRVVVSTNTKNLQEQLFYKDLPQLREMLPLPFKAVLIKGRENYICERRWQELLGQKELSRWDAQALLYLFVWKSQTQTGDISENSSFDRNRFSVTWRKICSDRYLCSNRKCPHYRECYVMRLRKESENASIIVANHALLLADMRMENSTLGEYDYLVIDEAHNLMSAASTHLGSTISYIDIAVLFNQLAGSTKRSKGTLLGNFESSIKSSVLSDEKKGQCVSQIERIAELTQKCRTPAMDFFNHAALKCSAADSYNKLRIKSLGEAEQLFQQIQTFNMDFKELLKAVKALENILSTLEPKQVKDFDQLQESISSIYMRLSEIEGILLSIVNADFDNFALWIENGIRSDKNVPPSYLNYAPIEVNTFLNDLLYKKVPSIIFTSATLALRGKFRYFMDQSGLSLVEEGGVVTRIVDSPFDYDTQSKLLVTSFLPEPKDKYFQSQALSCLKSVLNTADVGTMVLFTAYRDLDAAYNELSDDFFHAQRPLFAQGKGGSRTSILEEFKKAKNAALLGTSSFWEGVDVQGESLSLLILYKIPFQVPSEPLVEAYLDKLEREKKDSFMHYMLPNALLRLRQGFGRLIRSKSDRGIVLIMDSRVSRKKYGQYFMEILPGKHVQLKDELEMQNEISRFFSKI